MKNNNKLSAFMTKILRHEPERFGVNVDMYGFCELEALVAAIKKQEYWDEVTREDIINVVNTCRKQRYKIEGNKIKARYGHSYPVIHSETQKELPGYLYHGTNENSLKYIIDKKEGIKKMDRESVHLSETNDFAMLAAKRRKNPKLLLVDTAKAIRMGVKFTYAGNEVWLSTDIPFGCFEIVT